MISDVPKKTAVPENETNEYRPNDSGKFLAQWLKESARRTRRPSSSDLQPATPATPATPIAQKSALRSVLERAKWPLIAVLIAIAYLQYFYVDVMVQIAALPAIIFFILINGQMPPV
jgi:hypothetical protein